MKDHKKILENAFFGGLEHQLVVHRTRATKEGFQLELDADRGIAWALPFFASFTINVLAYYHPDSPYYRNNMLIDYALEDLEHADAYIREDGSIDLYETNFHDPAETGFEIIRFFASPVALIDRFSEHTEAEERLAAKVRQLLYRLGNAASTLGFHTPNHRWVISAALSIADKAIGEPIFKPTIDRFFMEGIDCDENGEYTERSTGSYNIVCNHSMLLLAYFLQDPSFLEYPRRNAHLMYHFIEPDMTVNTLNSSRWDQGGKYSASLYYPLYLLLALRDRDPEFAYMADKLQPLYNGTYTASFFMMMTYYMLYPEAEKIQNELVPTPIPADRSVFLPNSNIARIYRPEQDMTMTVICSRHPVFLQMNIGSFILQTHFAGSFFGDPHSQFRASEITQTADGYHLVGDEHAGYRSQLEEKPETSNWRHMDHSKRQIINVQNFHTEIDIHLLSDGFALDIETSGCTKVPTKLEFSFLPGGKLDSEAFATFPKAGDYIFLKEGPVRYFIGCGNYLEIKGCFNEHTYAEHMRGAFPLEKDKVTLAMTAITPQKSHVEVRLKQIFTDRKE